MIDERELMLRPDYAELAIQALRPHLQVMMCDLVLRGWRFECSQVTQGGNRWWQTLDENGNRVHGIGGLVLESVVVRAAATMMRRDMEKIGGLP